MDVPRLIERFVTSTGNTSTENSYRNSLALYIKWCESENYHPLTLSVHQLHEYRDFIAAKSLAAKTKNSRYFAVTSFFRFLGKHGIRPENPFDHEDAPASPWVRPWLEVPEAMAWPSFQLLMKWALENPHSRNALIVLLLGINGLKPGEVTAANVEDLRLDSTTARLMLPSRSQTASTPLHDGVADSARWVVDGRSSGPMIVTRTGDRMTPRSLLNLVRTAARRAGIPEEEVNPTRLRATAGVTAARMGLSLWGIREMLGISDRSATGFLGAADQGPHVHGATAVWRRVAFGAPASDLLMQVERLLEDPQIAATAPVVLTGAALEQHLVRICEANDITVGPKPSIDRLKGWLVGAALLTTSQGADIDRWARWRNDEAHGRANASVEDARTMLREVKEFIAATGGLLRGRPLP